MTWNFSNQILKSDQSSDRNILRILTYANCDYSLMHTIHECPDKISN